MPGEHPVEAAIREGRIPESRRDHYMRLHARKPRKTARLLASLEPLLEPPEVMAGVRQYVEDRPHTAHAAPPAPTGPTSYPEEWLSAASAPAQVGGSITIEEGVGQQGAVVGGPGEVL